MESKPSSLTLLMRAESLEELYVFYDELGVDLETLYDDINRIRDYMHNNEI